MHMLGKQQEKGREGHTDSRKKHCAVLCCALLCAVLWGGTQHRKEEICVAVQFLITL
jgi:hypothetical protein